MKGIMKIATFIISIIICTGCATTGEISKQPLTLAIMPFTGAIRSDYGETLATLLTNKSGIQNNFNPILRTDVISAIQGQEEDFQRSIIDNIDTVTEIGLKLNVDYVLAGFIQPFKNQNFVFINLLDINTRRLVAGEYRQIGKVEEIPELLDDILKKIVKVSRARNKEMLELAVWPFSVQANEATPQETEVLAQIAAIEVVNGGKYAVLPRTQQINQLMRDRVFEPSELGDRIFLQNLGNAISAKYILVGQTGRVETKRYISMQIVNLEDGQQIKGSDAEYTAIIDCLKRIPLLTKVISDQMTEAQKERVLNKEKRAEAAAAAKAAAAKAAADEANDRKREWEEFKGKAFRNHLDIASGYFTWGDGFAGGGGFILGAHWSPIPFTAIGLEGRLNALKNINSDDLKLMGGGALTLGLVYPLNEHIKLIGDGILEINNFPWMNGLFGKYITPGFDAGLHFWFDNRYPEDSLGFDIKYRRTLLENQYLNSVGMSFLWVGGSKWSIW